MKVEFVISTGNTNRYFCGYEKYSCKPKFRHINFPEELETFETYEAAEKELPKIFGGGVDEHLRLQIEKHYIQ